MRTGKDFTVVGFHDRGAGYDPMFFWSSAETSEQACAEAVARAQADGKLPIAIVGVFDGLIGPTSR